MRERTISTMKLGFIVKGTREKQIVEALARRLLPAETGIHTVRLGGIIAIPGAYTSVLILRSKGYDHVTLVFDAESALPRAIAERKRFIQAPLLDHHAGDVTTVCVAVPE